MAGETRKKILDAAEKLLLLKGLARVTTKEIARETGLSEGALYRHFDHKEEIFFAIMAKHLPILQEVFETHQAGTGTVRENLITFARATMQYYEQLLPMAASFLADTELLAQLRSTLQPLHMGPHNLIERVALYLEEEQRMERITTQVPALTIATLLLGPCFQRVFNRQFLGVDAFHWTDQQFAGELVHGLMVGIEPS